MISRLLCLWKKNLILFLNQAVIFFNGFKFFKNKKKNKQLFDKKCILWNAIFNVYILYFTE